MIQLAYFCSYNSVSYKLNIELESMEQMFK